MPCPVRVRGPERLGRDGACVQYAEEVRRRDEPGSKVAESTTCQSAASGTGNCKTAMCNVWIGGKDYCSECATTSELPIDGACVPASGQEAKCTTNSQGACSSCGEGYFLHKGGCYQIGGAAGLLICTDTIPSDPADTAGKCATCAPGYFKNPTQAANKPPCIACNDTTGDSTNMGKAGCATCEPPKSSGVAKCTACLGGFFGTGSGDLTCTACTDLCKTCKGANNKCTSCNEGNTPYFKEGDASDGTGTCVAEGGCGNTHFPVAADKKCYPCSNTDKGGIANCQACTMSGSALTCTTCTGTNKPNTARTACVACSITDCASCDKENVCTACVSNYYLTPTAQCVDNCGKLGGYYADSQRVCKPCSPECASCTAAGADKCLSCPAGKALKYTDDTNPSDGTCVDECKTGASGCETCGAVIGGSRYCSRCGNASQAPLDGNCAANTARTKFCTKVDGGACTQCANNYFLFTSCLLFWLPCNQ